MKIQDEQMYHGAALAQIAEDDRFTAINALKVGGKKLKSAYKVNASIAVYLKYASKPNAPFKEYSFTFNSTHLDNMRKIALSDHDLYVALVCMKDREVCCISHGQLLDLVRARKEAFGGKEPQYTVLCTLKPNEAFRVNMNEPGKRKTYLLSKPLLITRRRFPGALFGEG